MSFMDRLRKGTERIAAKGRQTWEMGKLIQHYMEVAPPAALADMQRQIPALEESDYRAFIHLLDVAISADRFNLTQGPQYLPHQSFKLGITREGNLEHRYIGNSEAVRYANPAALLAPVRLQYLLWLKQQSERIRAEASLPSHP